MGDIREWLRQADKGTKRQLVKKVIKVKPAMKLAIITYMTI